MNIYSPYIYGSFTQSGSTSYFKENLGVGFIGGMHPSALFEVSGTTKGVLFPRMTEAQKNAIGSPATSLLIYQTDSASGYQYYNGTAWTSFGGSGGGVTGTTNYIPKFTGSTSLGDSQIYDSGTYVTIGGTSGLGKLNVWGSGSTLINVGDTTGGNYEGISSLNTGYLAAVNPSTNDYRYGPLEMNPAIMTMTFGGIDVMYGNITSGYVPTKATIGYADSSIFINYGTITKKVGINTINTTEQLTVDGAISVGNSNTLVDELKSMNAGGSMIAYNGNTYTYTLGPGAGWLTYNPASLIMDFKPWWGGVLMTLDGSTNTTSINGELTVTGNTSLQNLTATTISATTYQNLPTDVRVTGGTYAAGTATFTNNTGGTFNVTGFSTGTTTLDNRLLLTDSSTGLITFGGLSATSGGTTFNVGAIKAWFVDNYTDPVNPVRQYVELSAQTGIAVTNISGHSVTYIAVDSGGTIYQQATVFNPSSQRSLISLGAIVHTNRIFVNTINNQPVVASAPLSQLSDLIEGIGFFNINGNVFSPNGANLNINKSSGDVFKQGANFMNDNKNPHTLFLSGLTAPSNIRYRLQTGVEYANTAVIDPNNYDLNGVLTPVTGSKYTIQRINVFQSNLVRIQYGQHTYANLADAIQGIATEAFIVEDNILDNGLFRALLLVKANTTDLTNTADALFIEASKFGSTAGLGSLSTTTLQQAYNNSTAPEILINSTLGGLSIQNGTGNANNVTNLLEGINSTGSTTSIIRADGYISGTTFQNNSFIANSSGLSATTVTASTFTGNLTGLASLATSATTASNADLLDGQHGSYYYPASNPSGFTNNTGTVTGVNSGNGMNFSNFTTSGTITMGTPSSTTLISTNATTTNSHTHAFAPGGTAAQYITGAGTLVTFPTIVNTFVTGTTFNNTTYDLTLTRNDGVIMTANLGLLATDVKITGGTYNINTGVVTFTNTTGGTFNVTGFTSGMTDTFVTGGTYAAGTATFTRSNNVSFNVTGFNTGTVTSVAALSLGTTGTDLSSTVANGTTTPVITLNVPTASASNRGALSSTDWSTFNGKQPQLNGTGFVKAVGTTISYDNSTYVPTSRTLTINGTTFDLSADRSWSIGGFTGGTVAGATNFTGGVTANTISATTVTANNFTGLASLATSATTALNATNAVNVGVTNNTTTNATYYPTFVSATSGNNLLQVDSATLTFNPSTNTLTVANLAGNASTATSAGVATNSDYIYITEAATTNANYYIPFADATNSYSRLWSDAARLYYNPSIDTLYASNLDGNASTATQATNSSNVGVTNNTTTNATYYLGFVAGTSGNQALNVDSNTLTFNPSTNTLTVANMSGLASLATSATTALNSTLVNVTEFSTAPVNYNITFVGGVSGNNALGVDSTTLTYTPSTSTLTVPFISGLASLATSATTALNATSADKIDNINFRNSDQTSPISAPDTLDSNGIGYVTNISLYGQVDGALYAQAYSSAWQHQIFGDYRTGQLAVRGKNSGTWQAWRNILDSTNFTNYAVPTGRTLTINGTTFDLSANRSWTISASGGITGAGTSAYIPKFTGTTAIGNSLIYDNGSGIGISTTTLGSYKLNVNGAVSASSINTATYVSAGSFVYANSFIDAATYLNAGTYVSAGTYGLFKGNLTGAKVYIGDPFSSGPIGVWEDTNNADIAVYDASGGQYQYSNRNIRCDVATGYVGVGGSPTGAGRFEVQGDNGGGNVSIYATNDIIAFSDISIKENLRPIENVLERVSKSRGVLYDRTDNNAKDNIGFVAQELEEQFPELVSTNPDGTKAVKYQNATAVLFEAVKEQQKQIDSLQEQINNILAKLDK